jgi:hypothetical protein
MTRRPGKGRKRIALKDRLLPVLISLLSVLVVFGVAAYFVTSAPQWPRIALQFFSLEAIRERFGTERTLVVDLADDGVGVLEVPSAKEAKADGPRRWLTFQRAETSAADLIAAVAARYRIEDLTIEEPAIEAIIRRIYEEGL